MIREAALSDIPMLLELGREFAEDAGVVARTGWDDESARQLLETLISSEQGVVFVSDKGMIGGYVVGHPFNQSSKMFVEVFWRAKDGRGKALLSAAEAKARDLGAARSVMVAMDGMDRTRRLYARLGYEPMETQFTKELT